MVDKLLKDFFFQKAPGECSQKNLRILQGTVIPKSVYNFRICLILFYFLLIFCNTGVYWGQKGSNYPPALMAYCFIGMTLSSIRRR